MADFKQMFLFLILSTAAATTPTTKGKYGNGKSLDLPWAT